jgi:hypothetical protein
VIDMKKFILLGILVMVLALGIVVFVWAQLQGYFIAQTAKQPIATTTQETSDEEPSVTAETQAITPAPDTREALASQEGLPVRDLPLTEGQEALATSLGLNTEQMVLSPEVVACAEDSLGSERYQALLAGETPGPLEAAKLLVCLGQ